MTRIDADAKLFPGFFRSGISVYTLRNRWTEKESDGS
jgi:hypothetical protein